MKRYIFSFLALVLFLSIELNVSATTMLSEETSSIDQQDADKLTVRIKYLTKKDNAIFEVKEESVFILPKNNGLMLIDLPEVEYYFLTGGAVVVNGNQLLVDTNAQDDMLTIDLWYSIIKVQEDTVVSYNFLLKNEHEVKKIKESIVYQVSKNKDIPVPSAHEFLIYGYNILEFEKIAETGIVTINYYYEKLPADKVIVYDNNTKITEEQFLVDLGIKLEENQYVETNLLKQIEGVHNKCVEVEVKIFGYIDEIIETPIPDPEPEPDPGPEPDPEPNIPPDSDDPQSGAPMEESTASIFLVEMSRENDFPEEQNGKRVYLSKRYIVEVYIGTKPQEGVPYIDKATKENTGIVDEKPTNENTQKTLPKTGEANLELIGLGFSLIFSSTLVIVITKKRLCN